MDQLDDLSFWKRCCLILALTALTAIVAANDATERVDPAPQYMPEGCIRQYGPGERAMKKKPLKCAPMVEAPAHILTLPLQERQ